MEKNPLNNIGKLQSDRMAIWPIIGLWVLVGVADAWNRLLLSDHGQMSNRPDQFGLEIETPLRLERSRYEYYLTRLMGETEEPDTSVVAPTENQDTPMNSFLPGEEDAWSTSTHRYRLLAIFEAVDKFAVLDRLDLKTSTRDLLEVRIGDEIDGFVLDSISKHKVSGGTENGDRMEMTLFLPSFNKD